MSELLPFRASWVADREDWKRLVYIPGKEAPPPFDVDPSSVEHDGQPCFYSYRQRFRLGNVVHQRDGILGLLKRSRDDSVLRHEEVFPQGVAACLREREILRAETSSLLLWCDDPHRQLCRVLANDSTPAFRSYKDRFGCSHELRRIAEPDQVTEWQSVFKDKLLYLADGHHRFAAGWELAVVLLGSRSLPPSPDAPPNALVQLERNARAGLLLPPKSTDFYPKLAARLLWHEI